MRFPVNFNIHQMASMLVSETAAASILVRVMGIHFSSLLPLIPFLPLSLFDSLLLLTLSSLLCIKAFGVTFFDSK